MKFPKLNTRLIFGVELILFSFMIVTIDSSKSPSGPSESKEDDFNADGKDDQSSDYYYDTGLKELTDEEKLKFALLEEGVLNGIEPNVSLALGNIKNGTKSEESSPGCPDPYEGNPWVYYSSTDGETPKCYLAGRQGPCPQNMILLAEKSSHFGYCDCDCQEFGSFRTPRAYCLIDSNKGPQFERILTFVQNWDSCQVIFEQGFCPPGEWLVFGDNSRLGAFCEPRRCPPAFEDKKLSYYDFKNKKCRIVGDECGKTEYGNKYWSHEYSSWHPSCEEEKGFGAAASFSINPNSCTKKGERYSKIFRRCVKTISNPSNYQIG